VAESVFREFEWPLSHDCSGRSVTCGRYYYHSCPVRVSENILIIRLPSIVSYLSPETAVHPNRRLITSAISQPSHARRVHAEMSKKHSAVTPTPTLTDLWICSPQHLRHPHSDPHMADLATIKSELKLWEKQFRASNGGREPSKDDIKRVPEIGAGAVVVWYW